MTMDEDNLFFNPWAQVESDAIATTTESAAQAIITVGLPLLPLLRAMLYGTQAWGLLANDGSTMLPEVETEAGVLLRM